jgi:hypothetical protein
MITNIKDILEGLKTFESLSQRDRDFEVIRMPDEYIKALRQYKKLLRFIDPKSLNDEYPKDPNEVQLQMTAFEVLSFVISNLYDGQKTLKPQPSNKIEKHEDDVARYPVYFNKTVLFTAKHGKILDGVQYTRHR